jgi:tRNA G46 methylase TrmB
MLKYLDEHPKLRRHYQRILFAPNESLFISILRNNPSLNLVTDNNKRLINWSNAESGHPDVLRTENFEQLISSDRHFARKFDQNKDGRVLDMLDDRNGTGIFVKFE